MKLSRHRVLICGILSPVVALFLYSLVYGILTRFSSDREKDWPFRLTMATLMILVPFLVTVWLAAKDRRQGMLSFSGKIGVVLATLSLGLAWSPVSDGVLRWKQTSNMAMRGVAAPLFDTVDVMGNHERLSDLRGKVVLVNIWATWCEPCRNEMPKFDRLYQERKSQGFLVVGISNEDVDVQKKYLEKVPVTYPLLTLKGNVPALYRDIARYPAIFLIDRSGRLQPAPNPDQPFEKVQEAVVALLGSSS